jgi:CubicO group peptidase (beta-lactamase class C family)
MVKISSVLADDLIEPQRHGPHELVSAPAPRPWPGAVERLEVRIAGAGRLFDLAGFLAVTSSTALVVIARGAIVHEWYAAGVSERDRLLGNSATKSALALLTGQAATAGRLPGLDTPAAALVPELRGSGYAQVTVRQLLTMTSGTGWREDYHDPESPASVLLHRYRSGAGGLRDALTSIPAGDPPGCRYAYCTPDSLVLDWVRERATGETFAQALAGLWNAIGAEHPAVVGLDAAAEAAGVAMAGGALGASARDWARLGWLQIDGSWEGEQLIGADWIEASSRPEQPFLLPGRLPATITTHAGFGYHWWPLDAAGERVMADGMRGQFVYVDRPRKVVVVKTSAWPYEDPWWDRQCRDLCYLGLPAIADAV